MSTQREKLRWLPIIWLFVSSGCASQPSSEGPASTTRPQSSPHREPSSKPVSAHAQRKTVALPDETPGTETQPVAAVTNRGVLCMAPLDQVDPFLAKGRSTEERVLSEVQFRGVRQLRREGLDVRVDGRPPERVTDRKGARWEGLSLADTHTVVMERPNGTRVTSVRVSFQQLKAEIACLYDNTFYDNFRLAKAKPRDRCRCLR